MATLESSVVPEMWTFVVREEPQVDKMKFWLLNVSGQKRYVGGLETGELVMSVIQSDNEVKPTLELGYQAGRKILEAVAETLKQMGIVKPEVRGVSKEESDATLRHLADLRSLSFALAGIRGASGDETAGERPRGYIPIRKEPL